MSLTRRILDGAQSGFAKITQLVIVDDEPLSNVDAAALTAELAARRAARERKGGLLGGSPLAAMATSSSAARTRREQLATERGAKVRRERERREATARSATDDAMRRMKEQAARGGGGATASQARSENTRPPKPGSTEAQVAEWYRTLDLAPGADLAEIKSSYRKLMRKYHPDVHAGDAKKQKAATELSVRVTTAYNALTQHLDKR